ncbi:MAG: hypothetical protein NWE99_10900 [Candidatus Bathyarchaeota archaeon]|nr:hypothetical protein [Candidatus Bathyarchaeota archaeon]
MAITRVQGNARGVANSGNSVSITMSSAPTQGNVLVLTFGLSEGSNYPTNKVSNITQSGVSWSLVVAKTISGQMDGEIWLGTVGANASPNITVNLDSAIEVGAVADVCEYSGVAIVDKTASANGSDHNPKTGTTETTTQAEELWIGCISTYGTQTNPENGFTLLDGAQYGNYMSLGFLEKIVSATGQAQSGVITNDIWTDWSGCIATFNASSPSPPTFDYIQLYTEGSGKKLRYRARAFGSETAYEQVMGTAQEQTYIVCNSTAQAHAQNKHFISLFNGSGSGKKLVIKDIRWKNAQLAAITNPTAIQIDIKRITAQGSGGTSLTPQKLDSANTNVPAQITALEAPTTAPTEDVALIPLYANQEEVQVASEWAHTLLPLFGRGTRKSQCQQIVLREGEGITIKEISAEGSPAGASSFQIIFTLE